MSEFKLKEEWAGEHRGIRCKVVRHRALLNPTWCYYIYLPKEQIPTEYQRKFFISGDKYYFDCPIISNLDWHGGITYYEKEYTDGKLVGVEMGCDYAHAFDDNKHYELPNILEDMRHSVDVLRDSVPLKWQSTWDHSYHNSEEQAISHGKQKQDAYKRSNHLWAT